MSDTTNVSTKDPNLRFGISFLDIKYADRAAKGEAMMDKTTGEIVYKRESDGSILYFNRENMNIEDWLIFMESTYQKTSGSIYPTKDNCSKINSTYLLGTNFDLTKFIEDSGSFENGGIKRNTFVTEFNITHESNGFFAKLNLRPRDVTYVNLISEMYDRYFKDYNGVNNDYIAENAKFAKPNYFGNSLQINYTYSVYKNGEKIRNITDDGFCRPNEICYIPFNNSSVYSRDDADYCTLEINYVTIPKLKYGIVIKSLVSSDSEKNIMNIVKDNDPITMISLDTFTYSTTTDIPFATPSPNNSKTIQFIKAEVVNEAFERIEKMSGSNGFYFSTTEPSKEEWISTSIWGENVREVYTGGEVENTTDSNILSKLEALFGKGKEIIGPFTVDYNDVTGFFVESIKTSDMTLENY